jgi:hypothetical protein
MYKPTLMEYLRKWIRYRTYQVETHDAQANHGRRDPTDHRQLAEHGTFMIEIRY